MDEFLKGKNIEGDFSEQVTSPKDQENNALFPPFDIECMEISEHLPFNLGIAIEYIRYCDYECGIKNLEKARWFIDREIERRRMVENDVS